MTKQEAIEYGKAQLDVFGGKHAEFIKTVINLLEQDEAIKAVSKRPNADVIERKDIDSVIEEMERHIRYNTDLKTGRVNILGQGQIMMLNILKNYLERKENNNDNR